MVYLDRDEVSFGRLPTCTVVLDTTRAPQMISRVHGLVRREQQEGQIDAFMLVDNKSMNGILVNGEPVDPQGTGRQLQPGDVITFGRKMSPPEFEYIFENPAAAAAAAAAAAVQSAEELAAAAAEEQDRARQEEMFREQMVKMEELQRQLDAEREAKRTAEEAMKMEAPLKKSRSAINVADLHSELACSICQDWLVHAATVSCSHTFCWACIDKWLLHKKFECPVCRHEVSREPVRTRAVEAIVIKTVAKLPQDQQDEYQERVKSADGALERGRKLHTELEKSVTEALTKGKAFFHIGHNWKRREKETFQRGVKDYTGDTRETYCRLTGLTVQWVHSADDVKLNQAMHNLCLPREVSKPMEQQRQRLLMFLRYG